MKPQRGLYAVTPDWHDTIRLCEAVSAVLRGGAVRVQYRNKTASDILRRKQVEALLPLCHAAQVPLLINDDVTLALALGADGVHLGRDDGDLAAARARLGSGFLLGTSCYNEFARAEAAIAAGADHVAFGAVFVSPTKPLASRAPLSLIHEARARGWRVACIGGITVENAPALIEAGADLLAVISDVFDAPDPEARARAYQHLFEPAP